jgi:bacterioferritin
MKAKEGVLDYLNKILTCELTAIHQYFLHAELCEHWGFERLEHAVRVRSIGEMRHAEALIKHILYLEGLPDMQRLEAVHVGKTVPEQLTLDLAVEIEDIALLRNAVAHCANVGDFTTRHLLEHMLKDSEEHIDWIETQLETIKQVGTEKYLSEQIHKEAEGD